MPMRTQSHESVNGPFMIIRTRKQESFFNRCTSWGFSVFFFNFFVYFLFLPTYIVSFCHSCRHSSGLASNTTISKKGSIDPKMTPLLLLPWQQFCHWCSLNKNWNFQFLSLPRTYYPTQSIDGSYDNIHGDYVCSKWDPLPHFGGCKWRFGFWTEIDWSQKSYYGKNTKGVICFFCDGHLWCQVSRTLL